MENVQLPAVLPMENSLEAYAKGLNEKLKVCEMLVGSGILPNTIKTPQAFFAIALRGQELGFSPMQSAELFAFINGKVALGAAGLQALCIAHGGKFEVIKEDDDICTIRASRKSNGWSATYSFSQKDAERMGLTGKENWKKMPSWMRYARCISVLCRRGWADVVAGYSAEELQDSDVIDAEIQVLDVDGNPPPDRKAIIAANNAAPKPQIAEAQKVVPSLKPASEMALNHDLCWVYDLNEARKSVSVAEGKKIVKEAMESKSGEVEDNRLYVTYIIQGWDDFCKAEPVMFDSDDEINFGEVA